MELIKASSKPLLKFTHEDIVFHIKPEATEEDRLEAILSGRQDGENIVVSRAEYCKVAIQRMVVAWENVKRDGVDVPYSFEELRNFPRGTGKNVLLALGTFIIENTNISKQKDSHLKKD